MALNRYVDVLINNKDCKATLKEPLVVFEKDKNAHIYFRLVDYRYQYKLTTATEDDWNIVYNLKGADAWITIVKPDGTEVEQGKEGNNVNNVILKDAYVRFILSPELTDEITEIGTYLLQIHITDKEGGEVTIPSFSFEVKERLKGTSPAATVLLLTEEGNNLTTEQGTPMVASGNGVTISSLPARNTYTGNEYMAVAFNGITYKMPASLLKGKDGTNGKDGVTPTIRIGTITTLPAGTNATVTATTSNNVVTLDFGIPRGADGSGGSGSGDGHTHENKTELDKFATGDKAKLDTASTQVVKNASDIAQITKEKGTLANLQTTNKTDLVQAINEVFTGVNNGKTLIASAITDKGIATSNTDSFQIMANNIGLIDGGGTQQPTQTIIEKYTKLTDGWKFNLVSSVSDSNYNSTVESGVNFDDSLWKSVIVPHDWSIYNDFNSSSLATYEGGWLDGGDGWYRKILPINSLLSNKKILIYFDGVYMESDVYVNGTKVGTHKHGYTPFYYDITQYINFNSDKNVLSVFVRNQQIGSRWYSGSGIYRNVYLIQTDKVHIDTWGIFVTTPNLETELVNGNITTNVKIKLNNSYNTPKNIVLINTIQDKNGNIIQEDKTSQNLSVGNNDIERNIIVKNPLLWDECKGNIYKLTTCVFIDNVLVDKEYTEYGYRYFKFDKDTGFWLNGKNIKLKGVCLHHDQGCIGAELNVSAMERQVKMMKNMGCNAIRITHNPASPEFLNICAKEGMMAIEEIFDCWVTKKKTYDYARFFNQYAENDTRAMVNRGKNNPSIIMWSIGNEIPDTKTSNGVAIATNICNWIKQIDITRPTTIGENNMTDSFATSVLEVVDVAGYNYATGAQYEARHIANPNLKLYGSETTSVLSSRGVYTTDASKYTYNSYDNVTVGWGHTASDAMVHNNKPYIAGNFVWTGFDYIGEPTSYNTYPTKSSYFGIVDLAGIPKDSFYMYQSKWSDEPMIHVMPHWNWITDENVKVWVFSNCDKVELFLNGVSQGTRSKNSLLEKNQHEWTIPFASGSIKAVGIKNDKIVSKTIKTSGNANKINLVSDKKIIKRGSNDFIFATASIQDSNNIVVPHANNQITFSVIGGTIIGTDNGDSADTQNMRSNIRKAFSGKCICVVKPDNSFDDVLITATGASLVNGTVTITKGESTILNDNMANEPDEIINVTGVTLDKNNLTINIDKTVNIFANINPFGANNRKVTWSINNSNCNIVPNGLSCSIIGKIKGTSIITATTEQGNYTATCEINVLDATADGVLTGYKVLSTFSDVSKIKSGIWEDDNNTENLQLLGFTNDGVNDGVISDKIKLNGGQYLKYSKLLESYDDITLAFNAINFVKPGARATLASLANNGTPNSCGVMYILSKNSYALLDWGVDISTNSTVYDKIVITRTSNTMKLYVNGTLVKTGAKASKKDGNLLIGCCNFNNALTDYSKFETNKVIMLNEYADAVLVTKLNSLL